MLDSEPINDRLLFLRRLRELTAAQIDQQIADQARSYCSKNKTERPSKELRRVKSLEFDLARWICCVTDQAYVGVMKNSVAQL